ncbi:phosphorylase [Skermanella aerolata]|uniref:Phosphorylase n=1 Tax=Skermanella aerolata TaxID=393310 RepID=A0A512DN26_9PROT|nr:5'-methylthioadenosine/S-adenosylhomocysteine nucleosidase [Skermanella aerolata]KJB94288.1 phosphorylase [Skermanella aerolata KACC 11604]GEO37881.1 phosphorylase [Skermanella aerolata]
MILQNAASTILRPVLGTLGGMALCVIGQGAQAEPALPDTTPRSAVVSAFQPEWLALQANLEDRREHVVNGTVFLTGTIEAKPVVLFLSGISMVNAAMTTQLALDRFTIDRIVFSGIAGGVDPDLKIGDVVVPSAWSQYLEAVFARETPGGYQLPPFADRSANFGMIFPQSVEIARGKAEPERKTWFPVDAKLLEVAKATAAATELAQCTADNRCLSHRPKVVVGGNGVSGQAFVDNKAFREYTARTFDASVLDMESAAVAHVAYANGTPFIAFRSLSDLAGGGDGENEMQTFFQLASENSAAVVRAFLKAMP